MGFCAVHMQKIKASGVRGIQSHMNREHPSKTNPDIDPSKTKDNWHIWRCEQMTSVIDYNIKTYAPKTKTVRKDAVVLCCFIVSSDAKTMEAMGEEKRRQFFKDSEAFFSRRYGGQNIVYAAIHADEAGAEHMHLGMTPIKDGKLCCKDMFDAKELRALQTAFYEQVGKRYGLERGVEGSERKHLSETRYKAQKAAERVSELEGKVQDLEAQTERLEAQRAELPALQEQIGEAREELAVLEAAIKGKNAEGERSMGSRGWAAAIEQSREQKQEKQELSLLRRFVQLPGVRELWQRFLQEQSRTKSKSKKRDDLVK